MIYLRRVDANYPNPFEFSCASLIGWAGGLPSAPAQLHESMELRYGFAGNVDRKKKDGAGDVESAEVR